MVDTSWSLSLLCGTSRMSPSGVATVAKAEPGKGWLGPPHRLPHPKAAPGSAPSPCPACQQQRPMLSPHVALLLPGAGQLPQALSILEGPVVHLHRDGNLLWVCPSWPESLSQHHCPGTYRRPDQRHRFHTAEHLTRDTGRVLLNHGSWLSPRRRLLCPGTSRGPWPWSAEDRAASTWWGQEGGWPSSHPSNPHRNPRRPVQQSWSETGLITLVLPQSWEDLERETATHSSILAWEIPWTEEPMGLQFIGSQSRKRLSN